MSGNKIIEKINVVSFDVNCVSGTISRDESADANIFTSGSVRYMDPKHLRAFTSVRQAANRACRVKGVRFLSGWAVPDESVENLVIELNEISGKVVNEKSVLIRNWNDNIQRWIDANPLAANYQSRFIVDEAHHKGRRANRRDLQPHYARNSGCRNLRPLPAAYWSLPSTFDLPLSTRANSLRKRRTAFDTPCKLLNN